MLFRHLKSEWYKYLLEILVVVVGVFIAYTLNNIKESNRLKNEETLYYNDILLELHNDLNEIRGNKDYNQRYINRYEFARKIILTDKLMVQADTLARIATELFSFSDFKKKTYVYEVLAASGKLDLISNKKILYQLQNLEILYMYINRLEDNQQDLLLLIIPKIFDFIKIDSFKAMRPKKLYSYKFLNFVVMYIKVVKEKDALYKQTEIELDRLIKALKKELR